MIIGAGPAEFCLAGAVTDVPEKQIIIAAGKGAKAAF
jgi:alkyl hydroperoxide reductase subunit AhpF